MRLSFYDSRELDVVVGAQAWIGNFAGELFSSQGHLGTLALGGMQFDLVTYYLSVCRRAHQARLWLALRPSSGSCPPCGWRERVRLVVWPLPRSVYTPCEPTFECLHLVHSGYVLTRFATVEAIQAGTDVALVCGAEVQNTVSAREGT